MTFTDLAGMKLGCRGAPLAPIVRRVGATPPLDSYGSNPDTKWVEGQNTIYPDCVPTAYLNGIQAAKAVTGDLSPIANTMATQIYKIFDPTLTLGMNPEDMYAWGLENTVAGWKLKSWNRVDHADEFAIRSNIKAFYGVAFSLALSLANQNQRLLLPGATAADQPGTWGNHSEWSRAFSGEVTEGISWGLPFYLSRSYLSAPGYLLAAYALEFEKE